VRRLAAIGVALVAVVLALVLTGISGTGGNYRVDAIFDNADFLIAGQDVKVAGARVGSVEAVRLTPQRKARVVMRIDPGFAPFRANAECNIRPQSLIGEKFVECDPGTPDARPLRKAGEAPTVPLEQSHSPVDLDVVFTALRLPLRQRLSIVLNELGTGLAGRPHELNAAIRRANPALQRTARTLRILGDERRTLARLIDASDRVIGELAGRRREVAGFIDRAESVTSAVASRRGDLDLAVRRLPPLLAELEPAAVDLTAFATDARPVVRALGAAAPSVRALLSDFEPLADATRPTLVKLDRLSRTGRRTIRAALPVARLLEPVAERLPPAVALAKALVDSLEDRHAIEQLGPYLFYSALAAARFDRVSHVLPSYQISGSCQQFATTPTEGCDAHFAAYGGGSKSARRRAKRARDERTATGERAAPGGGAGPGVPGTPGGGGTDRELDIAERALRGLREPGDPTDLPTDMLDWLLRP
jgi:ABC-type transporter Mla subunit MlaD